MLGSDPLQVNALSVGPMTTAREFRSREFRLALACVAISIGLHAAFLFGSRMGDFHTAASEEPAGSSVEVRLSNIQTVEDGAREQTSEVEAQWRPLRPIANRKLTVQQYPALLEFRPLDIRPRTFNETAYRPLAAVTLPPAPIQPVAVAYPEGTAVRGTVTARVTLFIDEEGNVAKVSVAAGELPDAFAQAAKDAFEPAKFRPGQVDGAPVKVRMVVDVEFEDRGERRAKRNRAKAS